jgi:molybdenum-dependent DNA-binding transcriptional regulator ModE
LESVQRFLVRLHAKGIQVRIAELHEQGISLHQISHQLGIGYGTAWNYVQRLKKEVIP